MWWNQFAVELIIYDYLFFQKIYLYAKDLEEDKCKNLMINLTVWKKKWHGSFFASNDRSNIIDVDDLDSKVKNLFIF